MFATLKTPVFLDSVVLEFSHPADDPIRAVLRDETGFVCSSLHAEMPRGMTSYRWNGLSDLPYGRYTLEILLGEEAQQMKLIKRI
jgi:hypothetical protein